MLLDLDAGGVYCVRLLVRAETEHGERSERVVVPLGRVVVDGDGERVRWQLDGWVRSAAVGELLASPGRAISRRRAWCLLRLSRSRCVRPAVSSYGCGAG